MAGIVSLVLFCFAIIILAWVLLVKEPNKRDEVDIVTETDNDNKPEEILIEQPAMELPEGFIDEIRSILGQDIEDKEIALVWDSFVDNPSDADYYILMSSRLGALGNFKKAQDLLSKAKSLIPDNHELLCNLGAISLHMHDPRSAEKAYSKALEIKPDSKMALSSLGSIYIGLERYKDAEKVLIKALEFDPEDLRSMLFLGIVMYYLKNYEESYRTLNNVYKIDQRIAQVHFFIGLNMIELDSLALAEKALAQYLEMQPEGKYAAEAESRINEIQKKLG